MTRTYREQFSKQEKAREYEGIYSGNSYANVLWEVEKVQLARLVEEMRQTHGRISYLDFAAGTGRVVSFMEPLVDEATAIEISPSMAEIARKKLEEATVLVKDITTGDDEVEGQYDLITSFRFILNAEPGLRTRAMRALAARLRDRSSRIVFNNHGNLISHKLGMWPLHALRRRGKGYQSEGNYLTDRAVRTLASEAGLEILQNVGAGFLSDKMSKLLSYDRMIAWEKRLAESRVVSTFSVNQMYVARLK